MKWNVRRVARIWLLPLVMLAVVLLPATARAAAAADDEEVHPDARLEGYPTPMALKEPGGIAGTVVVLILLAGITVGVMFINSKRSHLD